ncbi:nucleotidyltransferase substrate binding protein [Dehalobacterium formicoaceticum]|uniref:Nucleotidyltransferase substrate binding protein n=1 Tax=Dehalobacterium formicoaceticum TaxID=51515 RepID=A0ABT1Y1A9_9FIRM|nr:nucleotidyltransferase substrate binding protein [Dehalobacterium formicoaceticum]MCR6544358.1 nucleotidyltransferase substrate binding protein [Dehalobacterium formicoaceticum]
MSKHRTKFDNFTYAIKQLKNGVSMFSAENDLLRDGLIQRFEFTFELAWKTLKVCFEDEGLLGINSPKSVLREAFSTGLLDDDKLWLEMLNDRNSTSHIYSESLAIEICNKIIEKYADAFESLASKIRIRYFE